MSWMLWLAAPIGATVLAALWIWARGWADRRRSRPRSTAAMMREHERYLAALVLPARSAARPAAPVSRSGPGDGG